MTPQRLRPAVAARPRGAVRMTLGAALAALFGAPGAHAYPSAADYAMSFSADVQGPTIGSEDLGGQYRDRFSNLPILGTDILTPQAGGPPGPNGPTAGPLEPPGILIGNPPVDPTPGLDIGGSPALDDLSGWGELDALSYGNDPLDLPVAVGAGRGRYYVFSVDEFAIGLPGSAVRDEGALGDREASADTFIVAVPTPGGTVPGTNAAFTDGDGLAPSGAPGVGLVEPNAPTVGSGGAAGQIDPGDNLDAVDFGTTLAERSGPVYFSLDAAYPDPLEVPGSAGSGLVPNYGTAAANGFVGGDVLVGTPGSEPGGSIDLYAPASALGLDLAGTDSDDLDALKLAENGDGIFQVSVVPFDWLAGTTDMLLFSVRRGSQVIGRQDSIFGIAIEEGDVLTAPCAADTPLWNGGVCVGGPTPGIFAAAEQLGLATVRGGSAAAGLWGVVNPAYGRDVWADDLDGLDQVPVPAPLALLFAGLGALAAQGRTRRPSA